MLRQAVVSPFSVDSCLLNNMFLHFFEISCRLMVFISQISTPFLPLWPDHPQAPAGCVVLGMGMGVGIEDLGFRVFVCDLQQA